MTKTSIRKKVSSLTVKVSLISAVVIGMIAIAGLFVLRENTVNISGELGETAAADSQRALEERMLESLSVSAGYHAALIDAVMSSYESKTILLARAASDIVQNPNHYTPNPVAPPDPANAGIHAPQLIWAEGLDISAIADEVAIMGNIQEVMATIADKGTEVAYFIGLEQGYFIITDHFSHQNPAFLDPRERPWYQQTVSNNALTWTDIYRAVSGTEFSIACAMPFYDRDGNIAGVAATSQDLFFMVQKALANTGQQAGDSKRFFILNEFGTVVVSDNVNIDERGKVVWENVLDINDPGLSALVRNMLGRESGVGRIQTFEKEFLLAYAPINTLPWSFAVAIEVDEVFAPAAESRARIIAMTNDALNDIGVLIIVIIILFILISALTLLVIGYSSRRFADALTNPIMALEEGVSQIASGNFINASPFGQLGCKGIRHVRQISCYHGSIRPNTQHCRPVSLKVSRQSERNDFTPAGHIVFPEFRMIFQKWRDYLF